MFQILLADGNSDYRAGLARLLAADGYYIAVADSVQETLDVLRRKQAQVVVIGPELEGLQAADLIPLLKSANRKAAIVLVADDPTPLLARRIRQAGIFYHALRPACPEDATDMVQAVQCAYASLTCKGQVARPLSTPNEEGERHESEATDHGYDGFSVGNGIPGPGSPGGSAGSQQPGGLGLSRLLRPDHHCPTGPGHADAVRHAQGAGRLEEQVAESIGRIVTQPLIQMIAMEVKMIKWVILGGAVLLAVVLTALAAKVPVVFQGFSGLVIWIFLGFCSIIVVAQLFSAIRALLDLLRRPMAEPIEQPARGGKQ